MSTAKARVSVDLQRQIGPIDDRIYSGFTELMGRCIYGGLIDDPKQPSPKELLDENGYRKDVLEALKEFDHALVRFPGGNFCANYHWIDGVDQWQNGVKQERPRRHELAWLAVEPNFFGTDEFMKWCEVYDTEPYLCLNMGTGSLAEALSWLEYCNGKADTTWANLRRKNGHEEPYNVKYWAIGNECWGPWQVGQVSAEDYAKTARQWIKAMKLLDPSIEVIVCGKEGNDAWDYVVSDLVDVADYYSIHLYTRGDTHLVNATAPQAAEKAIDITTSLLELAAIQKGVKKVPKICLDEWNMWNPIIAPGEKGAEQQYSLSDTIAMASWLNVFMRSSQKLAIANIAQSVNVISPITTKPDGLLKQATFFPFALFSKYMRGTALDVSVHSDLYTGMTNPPWLADLVSLPHIDCSAAYKDGTLAISLCNRHDELAYTVDLDLANAQQPKQAKVYTVTGPSLKSVNTWEKQEVTQSDEMIEWTGQLEMGVGVFKLILIKL